jgi:hypothetical protein
MQWSEIPEEIQAEILDPNFDGLRHGKSHAVNSGCKGPLCKYFVRQHQRKMYAARRARSGKTYKPDIETRKTEADATCEKVLNWYGPAFKERKKFEREVKDAGLVDA